MGKRIALYILSIVFLSKVHAQKDSTQKSSIYKINYKVEAPITAVGALGVVYGMGKIPEASHMTEQEVFDLSKTNISAFERPVLNFSESGYKHARTMSDNIRNASLAAPALLFIGKKFRSDWKDIILLYGETHVATSLLYQAAAFSVRKPRPLAYNTSLDIQFRSGNNLSNAFFSGHVSSTATSTFFMAKVFSDYTQLSKLQKGLIYVGATIPPAIVGYYRMQAGKHFRTDVLTGLFVGAAAGILVPELHKRKSKINSFSFMYNSNYKGLALKFDL